MLQVHCMVNNLGNFSLDIPGIIDAILAWKLNIYKERLNADSFGFKSQFLFYNKTLSWNKVKS